ncbi:MAG TPA: rod shape-determining protein MreD [Longimicrobiales bacterium]|nr:rod shape-determining protein MreD [Longimicrobiales bacterium]
MAPVSWRLWAFLLVLVVAYFTLTLALGLGRAAPDLLAVAVLLAARRLPGAGAAAVGFVLGIMRDALSLTAFGASTVALTLVAFLAAKSRELFIGDSLLFIAAYLFVGKWLYDAVFFLLARHEFRESALAFLLIQAPLAAAYAAVTGAVALIFYRMIAADL